MSDLDNMLRFHREGLQRFSSIIDGNPNYDDLMEHRLGEEEWKQFDAETDDREKRTRAAALFESKFGPGAIRIILPEFAGIAFDGNTKNNIREFEFLERICAPLSLGSVRNNYAQCDRVSVAGGHSRFASAMETITSEVRDFYQERRSISASLVRQQILYSRSFLSFLISFSQEGAVRPTALVQANDHSPVRVALSMIMKGLGVPRIYLQHAEVTRHFPPLDFEYSVLRNRNSLETYKSIGAVSGKAYVIPRHESAFALDRLVQERETGVPVVIYPTSRVHLAEMQKLVGILERSPVVGKVLIKQHPGAARQLNHGLNDSGVTFVDEIPDEDHIAIVGNSSVAMELLHRGIPVYQNFDFDPVERDYYGLVKSGLTQEVSLEDLSGKFWRPYRADDSWLDAYAGWDPSADSAHLREQAAFLEEMGLLARRLPVGPPAGLKRRTKGRLRVRVKGGIKRGLIRLANANPVISSRAASLLLANAGRAGTFLSVNTHRAASFLTANTDLELKVPTWRETAREREKAPAAPAETDLLALLEFTLGGIVNPSEWFELNERAQAFPPLTVITVIETMFQNRRPALNALFRGLSKWPRDAAAGTWAYLKKLEWGNIDIGPDELDAIAAFVYGYDQDARVRSWLEQALLLAILRSGTCGQLDRFWANAATVTRDKLSINRVIQVLRKLRDAPGREAEAERVLEDFRRRASPFDLLKLNNMELLEGRPVEDWDHHHMERQFALTAPRQLSQEFAAHVQPVYETLRPTMRFMNVRTKDSEAQEFLGLVRNAIERRAPFSLIRLSDGEGYLFPEGTFLAPADAANRERHWWGTELSGELRLQIVGQARQAIATADVVGIPAIYRFIRDNGDGSSSLTRTVQGRGLLQVLEGVSGVLAAEASIAEDKINVALFGNLETVVSLATLARRVILVGSVRPDNLPGVLRELPHIQTLVLPTHARTTTNDKYQVGDEPLPVVYPALLDALDALALPGNLVLVAGGIIGKIFVGHARAKGAVALDIGSVLDDWVQAGSRSMR